MKTIHNILYLFIAVLVASCSESDLVAQRVYDYPERVNSEVIKKLNSEYNQDIEILTMDVFHPAITQLEPTYKEFIDSNEYLIFIQARNNSKIAFCYIKMDKYYNIYIFRKERSWPSKVPEERQKVNRSS